MAGLSGAAALVAFLFASQAAAMPSGEAGNWRSDLRYMASELEKTHKNLYHTVSRKDFAALVAGLELRIPSLERHQVIVEMAKIVAAVADGHTNIYPTRDPKIAFRTLPVAFSFFGDHIYLRAVHESQWSLLGAQVLRIGDHNIADAYSVVRTMIGRDNDQGARYWAPYLLAMPEVLHALGITRSMEEIPVTLATSRGEETVILTPFEKVSIMSGDTATHFNRRPGWIDIRDRAGRPDPLWLRSTDNAFHFERAGHLLYVQINRVQDKPDETLAQFAERLYREIRATRPKKVVFDLRLNRGGDGTLITPLIRSLIRSEGIDRRGRLFGIIGPATFSAAQMLADAMEKYTNITFVGEPTGSKGNAYGDSRKIVLPYSGITVRASVYYWQDWHPLDKRDALIPRISAPLTFDAYRNNVDTALEAIEKVDPFSQP